MRDLGFKLRISLLLLSIISAHADNPLQSLQDGLTSIVSGVNGTLQNATSSTGSAITSLTNSTGGVLLNATESVGQGLNTTVNSTYTAAQSIANASGSAAATVINQTGLVAVLGGPLASTVEGFITNGVRHPFIFWPGFGTARIYSEVEEQDLEPACPSSGGFHTAFGSPTVLEGWPEDCIYKVLQLQYDPDVEDFNGRFSSQPGVNTTIPSFGSPLCAPIPYEPMYLFFEAVGFTAGEDFFVACYDWRTTPYQDVVTDGPHLERAAALVEEAYSNTGLPVYLGGHSNGPLYALALLASKSEAWRSKYIAGFAPFAGNFAGQGSAVSFPLSGYSLFDSSYNAKSAPALETWPGVYMSMSDPKIYNDSEVFIQAPSEGEMRNYTALDYVSLFEDANMTLAQEIHAELIGNLSAKTGVPGTHFYGFYGAGLQTLVGVTLDNLTQGTRPQDDGNIYALGDSNQEETDNLAALEWKTAQDSCYHFELNRQEGVSHTDLPFSPSVLARMVNILFTSPKDCSRNTTTG